jgi:glucose/arabinose dehydrogenase
MIRKLLTLACAAALLGACGNQANSGANAATAPAAAPAATPAQAPPPAPAASSVAAALPFAIEEKGAFNEPWAMTFLPDGRLLVTEKKGVLKVYAIDSQSSVDVSGVPAVAYGGQGGLGDVVLHPKFADNGWIYLSYAEGDDGKLRGAAVARGKLTLGEGTAALSDVQVIWRQSPKVEGEGHYGHRIAFAPDGHLFISSGERQKFDPAQDMTANLGKIVRLNEDGSVPKDNPFADQGDVAAQVWTLGHRNPLGLAFDAQGRLWNQEMGPKGGDELNLVVAGRNYGYPIVSNGDHYDGRDIPDHPTRPEFEAPKVTWNPVISPGGLVFYSGSVFPDWQGDAFIGGLSSMSLVRIEFEGDSAREAARYDMGERIREVEQGPDGALWLLQDQDEGKGGKLLRLIAAAP